MAKECGRAEADGEVGCQQGRGQVRGPKEGPRRTRHYGVGVRSLTSLLLCANRRHRRDNLLLATDNPDDKALAIKVAFLIEADVEQHSWVVLGEHFRAMQGCSERLGIELASLLRHRLDYVNGTVAFHSVVIGPLLA